MDAQTAVIAAFYFSTEPGAGRVRIGEHAYVRMEPLPGVIDLESALDQCQPQPDEAVMNTHFIDPVKHLRRAE